MVCLNLSYLQKKNERRQLDIICHIGVYFFQLNVKVEMVYGRFGEFLMIKQSKKLREEGRGGVKY